MMYADTLPTPTFSSASRLPEPKTKNSAAGKTRAKMIVRRLRSIRVSSMRSRVGLRPPNGGTRRSAGRTGWVVVIAVLLRARGRSLGSGSDVGVVRPVRLRKASSRPWVVISRSRASVSVSR